jgi:cell division inhibitor SulA
LIGRRKSFGCTSFLSYAAPYDLVENVGFTAETPRTQRLLFIPFFSALSTPRRWIAHFPTESLTTKNNRGSKQTMLRLLSLGKAALSCYNDSEAMDWGKRDAARIAAHTSEDRNPTF